MVQPVAMAFSLGCRLAHRSQHIATRTRAALTCRLSTASGAVHSVSASASGSSSSGGGGGGSSSSSSSLGAAATLKFQVEQAAAELGRAKGPLALYEALVAQGELRADADQQRVMEYLNAMYHGVPKRTARGLYLYGSVGCGKTMVMDLFFSSVGSVPGLRVVRKHFHDFLHDVQLQLHRLKRDEGVADGHPVERVGERLARQTDVLCFDEFAITTIQDCVLLMPLFSVLFNCGVTVVATSNRAPDDLYTDGLNRHLYLPPFLKVLHRNCKVHHLQSTTDYRAVHHENSPDAGVFCWPHDRGFIDQWFKLTTGNDGGLSAEVDVSFGRSVRVPQLSSCGRVARFSFEDLCKRHLSADDYMKLCRQFHTILLDDVPCLSVDDHNEARRFTTLVDHCYEHHVRLICSMAGPPEALLGGLSGLQHMSVSTLGQGSVGCGDGDTSPSSSGVLQAIDRVKASLAERRAAGASGPPEPGHGGGSVLGHEAAVEVLGAEVERVRAHGGRDVDVWRQGLGSPGGLAAPPQVSKAWDDRRRISQFTWESTDPTSEQQAIKGVFTAAIASLKESGFAVERAISRLREMQTENFQQNHKLKHLST